MIINFFLQETPYNGGQKCSQKLLERRRCRDLPPCSKYSIYFRSNILTRRSTPSTFSLSYLMALKRRLPGFNMFVCSGCSSRKRRGLPDEPVEPVVRVLRQLRRLRLPPEVPDHPPGGAARRGAVWSPHRDAKVLQLPVPDTALIIFTPSIVNLFTKITPT